MAWSPPAAQHVEQECQLGKDTEQGWVKDLSSCHTSLDGTLFPSLRIRGRWDKALVT